MPSTAPVKQHLDELLRNKAVWDRKPLLRRAYAKLYGAIRKELAAEGPVVELGSGLGAAKEYIPETITTDLFANPWIDRQENAYELSFPNESIGSLLLFDVFHHLEFPGAALHEFHRVLRPGGRVLLMEPGFGWAGRLIYTMLHHEPVAFNRPISWLPATPEQLRHTGYYAAQANGWRIFVSEQPFNLGDCWRVRTVQKICALCYVATGGFSKPALIPPWAFSSLAYLEGQLQRWPRLFATRLLVTLEKR